MGYLLSFLGGASFCIGFWLKIRSLNQEIAELRLQLSKANVKYILAAARAKAREMTPAEKVEALASLPKEQS